MKKNKLMNKNENWDFILENKKNLLQLNLYEIYQYRDLIFLTVKKDFVTFYKQTILGPLWYIIQPLVNTLVFTIIFGNLAKIPTDGITPFLFYMAGTIVWSYFAVCLNLTSKTFNENRNIFAKVYFPRLIIPIANVILGFFRFFLQFIIFTFFILYFYIFYDFKIIYSYNLFFLPLLLLQIAMLGFGVGILISSLTTKYKDLAFLMNWGIQLWMFATPIVYPISLVPDKYRFLCSLNPMTSVVEIFKMIMLGESSIESQHVINSVIITLLVFFLGLINFKRIERNFLDTI